MFTSQKLNELFDILNEEHPLPEVALSLIGTTFDIVSIRVDNDGYFIKLSFLTEGPHGAPGNGIDLDADIVRDYTGNEDRWEDLKDPIIEQWFDNEP